MTENKKLGSVFTILVLSCTFNLVLTEISRKRGTSLSLASYYGDHMVLQKGPAKSTVWGYSPNIDDAITVQLINNDVVQSMQTTVYTGPEGKGVWKVQLKPVPAGGPYTLNITDTHGGSITVNDVMFGDVWVCSGQSNMRFPLPSVFNASAEIADANHYPHIRLFTVALNTASTPQYDFISIEEPWSVASTKSVDGGGWTYFSAVCWLYGKYLYQKLGYPIGLVATDWGGTAVETWSSPDALKKCGLQGERKIKSITATPKAHSVLWNAMVHPFLNYTIYGAIWYQGEANSRNPSGYNCTFPAMIDDWRLKFSSASNEETPSLFPFGFVQLAADRNNFTISTGFPGVRWSQTAGYGTVPNPRMKNVFMAVAMDLPDFRSPFGSIHPRDKQTVATRLVLSGLDVAYGQPQQYQGPYPSDVKFLQGNKQLQITYDDGRTNLLVKTQNGFEFCCSSSSDVSVCEQPSLTSWYPVTSLSSTSTTITLDVPTACDNLHLNVVRYAWRETPCPYKQCAVYRHENLLPGPPFKIVLI